MLTFLTAAIVATVILFQPTPSVIERVVTQLSDIDYFLSEDKGGHCTGVQVGIRWILTAEHCLPPQDSSVDVTANGNVVRIIKRDASLDLALLETSESTTVPIMEIRKSPPRLGEEIAAVGLGMAPGSDAEIVPPLVLRRSIARIGSNGYIYTDGTFIGGMSGGPVVDAEGKLIGLVRQGWDKLNIGGVIPASAIRKFIDGK